MTSRDRSTRNQGSLRLQAVPPREANPRNLRNRRSIRVRFCSCRIQGNRTAFVQNLFCLASLEANDRFFFPSIRVHRRVGVTSPQRRHRPDLAARQPFEYCIQREADRRVPASRWTAVRLRSPSDTHALASIAALLVVASASIAAAQPRAQAYRRTAQDPLRFQFLGPVAGGRISAVAGVVGDPKTWYIGAASGGVWKSSDSGSTYVPVFDSQPVQAIGALAVSHVESVHRVGGHRRSVGDPRRGRHGRRRLQVHGRRRDVDERRPPRDRPHRPHHPAPHESRHRVRLRVRPRDRAAAGARRLSARPMAARRGSACCSWMSAPGCSGLAIDANDPNVLFAGTWEVVMHTWAMYSGGPGSGVYVTRDGGTPGRTSRPGCRSRR